MPKRSRGSTTTKNNTDINKKHASGSGHEFYELFAPAYLRLRFDVVTTNKCPKFHIDHVAARLLCTCRGAGTEYSFLDDQKRPTEIFPTPNCAAIVFRGMKWSTDCTNKVVNQSPEINDGNETRLLFVIDPVDDADDKETNLGPENITNWCGFVRKRNIFKTQR